MKNFHIISSWFWKLGLIQLMLVCNSLHAQNLVNSCGSDVIVDTYVDGMEDNASNCLTISNTAGMRRAHMEVWIGDGSCNAPLPASIVLRANGINYTANRVNVTQANSGGEMEFIYRVTIPCLLYTSPSPRDATLSRMPSSA